MKDRGLADVKVTVVGAGGAGGNAIARMIRSGVRGVDMLALNTDVQALGQVKGGRTFAIGPETTGGMGSGGRPETGRKAMKESQEQVTRLLILVRPANLQVMLGEKLTAAERDERRATFVRETLVHQ